VDRLRSALSTLGAVLTASGVLILLFVAYQLWGTGIYAARAQDDLRDDFAEQLAQAGSSTTTTAGGSPTPTTAPPGPLAGGAIAEIRIEKIGMNVPVVEGVGVAELRKAPGHYPSTPLPGELGNAAIAGHRTTYGAPFNRLGEVLPGDLIQVRTLRGEFTYRAEAQRVVKPSQVEVLDPTPDARLTLTTCHPKYSAKERLIVTAVLVPNQSGPAPTPPVARPAGQETERPTSLADASLASSRSKWVTAGWGMFTALIGGLWYFGIRRWRRWYSYAGGLVPFLLVLFVFYAHLERLLPANF
jgi:sortase A